MNVGPILFSVFAVLLIVAASGVVLLQNPIRSALSLVVTLFLLAVMFISLDAHLVAALQVVVYAGAIMVLFLFVIMLLNLQEDRQALARMGVRFAAGLIGSLFVLAAARFLVTPPAESASTGMGAVSEGYGSTELLAQRLFTHYLFAFEVTSVLLLVAIIGAVVLAKRKLT